MNFGNDSTKSTQAVARLLEKSGGEADYLRIVKLIYLADRLSILNRGIPIVGGHYYSMRSGPTVGEIMHFTGSQSAPGWKEAISPRLGNRLTLTRKTPITALSESEIALLDSVVEQHSNLSTSELVEWCHQHCPEYEEVVFGRKEISVEAILRGGGKGEHSIKRVIADAKEVEELDELLA